jgi:hypothetical protein
MSKKCPAAPLGTELETSEKTGGLRAAGSDAASGSGREMKMQKAFT